MPKLIDRTGQRFGRLLVVEMRSERKGNRVIYLCKCDCGILLDVNSSALVTGNTTSCGCYAAERASALFRKHGSSNNRGQKKTSDEYGVWSNIRQRCGNSKNPSFKDYGRRGIALCAEWNDFNVFLADMGNRPSKNHTIDRIDNDKGYSKANCRWATRVEQNSNKRSSNLLTYQGITKTCAEWERSMGFPEGVIKQRVNSMNWSIERALTTPVQIKQKKMPRT
jgi:hypothetical protein